MRKFIVAVIIAVVLIMSGISVTSFSTGQLTSVAWADDGGG